MDRLTRTANIIKAYYSYKKNSDSATFVKEVCGFFDFIKGEPISEADMNVRMEMEHGTRLSTLEVNAELAGVDLSGSKLEGYARTVIRSKNMLQIIDNALNTVRMDPNRGELMYQVLYLTYFSKKKPANREVILAELDRQGFPMSMVTYHSYLNMAIRAIDRILWGYTARDCMEIIKQFLP